MEIVDPRVDPRLVPEGSKAVVIAEHQKYRDLPSVRTPDGQVITRWQLSDEERLRILKGEDFYVTILSHGAINPLFVTVGPIDWTTTMDPFRAAAEKLATRSRVITVQSIYHPTRLCVLSCGHRFRQGAAMPMPELGAEAFCQICSKESQ